MSDTPTPPPDSEVSNPEKPKKAPRTKTFRVNKDKRIVRFRPKGKVLADQRKVAALVGAGLTPKEIGAQVGRSRRGIEYIIKQKIRGNAELQAIVQEARARVAPQAIAAVEESIATGRELLKQAPRLSDVAGFLRETANLSGLTRDDQETIEAKARVQIPMTPEAIAAMIEAVKKHQAAQSQPRDVTHEGERIE